jgi:hypothetical protein
MIRTLSLSILLAASLAAFGQAPTSPSTPPAVAAPTSAPSLTPLEASGIHAIFLAINTDLQTLHEAETEITKNHPGYHLDEASGSLVKDVPPTHPPEPEKKK